MDVERGSDCEQWHRQQWAYGVYESFLEWAAEPDQDDSGSGGVIRSVIS